MSWNYADMVHNAKIHGGPEAWETYIRNTGRKEMTPWLAVIGIGGALITLGTQQIVHYIKKGIEADKKETMEQIHNLCKDVDSDESALRHMEQTEYWATHPNKNNEDNIDLVTQK